MVLLGDDGRGYELARKLESHGVWRSWLGDSLYANFIQSLSSPSTWDAFMRTDDSKTRAQIHLQLRARALLFDKASVSLFLRSNQSSSSSSAISKLNPNYLVLHGDDVYFTLENCSQDGAQQRDGVVASSNTASSKLQSKAAFNIRARYGESDIDNMSQRFRHEELPETWYGQFFEKYRASKPYRLSFAGRETDERTPEQMSTYLRILEKHKRRRVAFRDDQNTGFGNPTLENGANMRSYSVLDNSSVIDDETSFFPETMFALNCIPDSALPLANRVDDTQKVEFNGVLDTLPQIMTRSPIMIERLGIRPEYLNQSRGNNGSEGKRRHLGEEQASQMSQKVLARILTTVGFEATAEVPMEVFSQLLSCHICKLGGILKLLADSYRKQCSAIELLKMFLKTAGHSNLGALAELVKDNTRNIAQQIPQQVQGIQSQFQSQHQALLRQPQQVPRQLNPQMQQMVQSQALAFQQQQQQQWEKLRRRQPSTPRPGMTMSMERPMVEVKIENPSEFPVDTNNAFTAINTRNPQMQFRQQQLAAMSNFHPQAGNQFRHLASLQIPQVQTPSSGIVRAPPMKVEGFQELMGGDATLKLDSDENKLTSPQK